VSFISLTIGNFQLIVNSFGVFMLNTETSDIWFESNPNFDLPYGTYILTLQTDGNLVGHNTANVQFWASNTAGEGSPPYTLSINSGGNCILSDANSKTLWQTGGQPTPPPTPSPTTHQPTASPTAKPITCTCNTPNEASPYNRYNCTDGTSAYCSSNMACTYVQPWQKSSSFVGCNPLITLYQGSVSSSLGYLNFYNLQSLDGNYLLTAQSDRNIVLYYTPTNTVLWASNTQSSQTSSY
jgi:hypothetical protein